CPLPEERVYLRLHWGRHQTIALRLAHFASSPHGWAEEDGRSSEQVGQQRLFRILPRLAPTRHPHPSPRVHSSGAVPTDPAPPRAHGTSLSSGQGPRASRRRGE